MSHIILLIHPKKDPMTRTYNEYESIPKCLDAICQIYEEHLKRRSPNVPTISYDVSELFVFIDSFVDISCVVLQKSTNTYAPCSKDWIKDQIYEYFRNKAMETKNEK